MSELKELFGDYDSANQKWVEAKKQVEEAYKARSVVIRKIFEANGNKKQIKRKTADGIIQQLTIVRRGDSWFFRGENDSEEVIE